ncbi:hypothetical protein F4823DRAFT_601658 [Ustulina deusta]|nr:hypothetical protein F4823DRAFT_601658 [Ustulina deusta]
MADQGVPCYLETLPPELIYGILDHVDSIRDLHHFIITGRSIYQRFEGRKRPTILRVLRNELGVVLADARFLYLFPYSDPGRSPGQQRVYWDHISNMATVYRRTLKNGGGTSIPGMEELTQLCHTLYKINFLTRAYFAAQQRFFGGESLGASSLSRAEKLRIMRAFYRRQIFSNAWAPTRRGPGFNYEDVEVIGNIMRYHEGLFSTLEPWEMQQIDHVDRFVIEQCKALCLADEWTTEKIHEAQFKELFSHMDCLVHNMRERPGITPELVSRLGSLEISLIDVFNDLTENQPLPFHRYGWQFFACDPFPAPVQDRRGQEGHDSEGAIDFVGDLVDLPPFGWIDATDGQPVDWFGNAFVHTSHYTRHEENELFYLRYRRIELWRDAGFALWDRSRVEALQKLEQLEFSQTGWIVY